MEVTGHELSPDLDILVVGAGQAGLALGFHLRKTPFRFQIVDRNVRVGDSWRKRFDSLVLFTPRAYSALPGLAVPGDPNGYPTKDEMADYLEIYANRFDLPVVLGAGIRWLERVDGGFRAVTEAGEPIECRAVVLATGAFQRPAIPAISKGLSGKSPNWRRRTTSPRASIRPEGCWWWEMEQPAGRSPWSLLLPVTFSFRPDALDG